MGEPRHVTEGGGGAPRPAASRRPARPPGLTTNRVTEDRERPTAGRAALVQLQALAGNSAVAGLLSAPRRSVQRLVGTIPPPPVAPSAPDPAQHPGFRAAAGRLAGARQKSRSHPSPRKQAEAAGRAAKPPADHKESQAKAAKAGEMGAAPVGGFDKAAFIAAVSAAIAKQAPKNLEEADKFAESDKSGAVAAEVKGKVGAGKDASAKPIADATAKAPDEGKAIDKPVTPLPQPAAPGAPAAINGKDAMPTKAPADQTELGNGPAETDAKLVEAGVTEDQLAQSNEPEFTGALSAKKAGEEHSATAPGTFRANEAQQLSAAQQGAQASGVQGAAGMVAVRGTALQQAAGAQRRTQTADEGDRATVTTRIKSIFDTTKAAVEAILNGIDPQVEASFTAGEARAKAAFTTHHKARMEKYKDERYDGVLGAGRWIRDKFADLPSEVNRFYVEAKQIYETQMRGVISDIADLVGRELTRAKTRITEGRTEITIYVSGLDPKLRSLGQNAAEEIGSQFESLEASVDEKSQSLADDLAEKYMAARTAVDEEIKALQEENKGLWSKAKDAIGGAIETILKLKDMLLGVLARAAGAVSKIIKDPIGFLGNFVGAVKAGVMNFGANILTHLKKGLQSWLFGALAEGGIAIPEKFDLKGIVGLILSLLGLTWQSIRARLAKVLPEWVLKALETAVDVVKILATEGVGGLWTWIVTKITDLKDQVMGQIKDFVITKIITAGITWLISLLNPAAAFIKACKMIYDAVMWFVDNAQRMKEFVDSVLDSVESIANGGVGAVASMIEATLGRAIPMVISGLASLLGLGGIAEKIKSILETIQKPVGKVVDKIIGGVVKVGKKLLGKLKKNGDDPKSEQVKEEAATRVRALDGHVDDLAGLQKQVATIAAALRPQGLKSLRLVPASAEGTYDLVAEASPASKKAKVKVSRDQRATVTVNAQVTFDKPPVIAERFGRAAAKDASGKPIMVGGLPVMLENALPATIRSVAGYRQVPSVVGGVIFPPQAGAHTVSLRTWNTGDPAKMSNSSHAESQLAQWLLEDADRSRTITNVSIVITGLCPCPACAGTLQRVRSTLLSRAAARDLAATFSIDVGSSKKYKDWANSAASVAALLPWAVTGSPKESKKVEIV